jgi:hypothetical protein
MPPRTQVLPPDSSGGSRLEGGDELERSKDIRGRRWTLRVRALLASVVCVVVVTSTVVAWADNITNDVTVGGSDTIAVTGSTTVRYKVVGTGGDGQSGCNVTDGSPATVTIGHPPQVTAVPEALVFTTCNSWQSVVLSSGTVGNFPITPTVSDAGVGSYSTSPAAFTLHVLDVTPPESTITSAPADLTGSSAVSFSFSGTDDVTQSADLDFECELDGQGYTACSSPATYDDLSDGSHTFHVRGVDASGNAESSPAEYSWIVDLGSPETTITSAPADLSGSSSAAFSFVGADDFSSTADLSFECELDDSGYSDCDSPATYNGLSDGTHTFHVRATDTVGNTDSSTAAHTWTVDLQGPGTTITSNPTNPSASGAASFTFTASDNVTPGADLTFECNLDGAGFSPCSSPIAYSNLSDGSHAFQVRATDALGNMDSSPPTHTWTIDRPDPVIDIDDTTPVAGGSLTVSGDGFAPVTEIRITMESDPVLLAITTADANGSFSVVVTIPTDAPVGSHTIKASGLDVDGVLRVLSLPITVGRTITVGASTDKAPLAATGSPIAWLMLLGLTCIAVGRVTLWLEGRISR